MNLKQVADFATEINEIALTEIKENKDKIKLEDTISEEDKKSGKYISLEKMVKTNEKLANTTIKIDKAEREEAKPVKPTKTKSAENTENLPYEQKLEMFLGDKDFFRAVKDLCGITVMTKLVPQAAELLKKNDDANYKNKLIEIEKFENAAKKFFEIAGIIEKRSHAEHNQNRKTRKPELETLVKNHLREKSG